jgi:hypothetical protein
VLIAAMVLLVFLSAAFLFLRFLAVAYHGSPLRGAPWLYSEWTWASLGITLAMSLIYRYAMSSRPVAWRASIAGGAAAAVLCMLMSLGSAFYVEQIAHLGATYGSVAAVVVFLIWLSWNVNAVFFGGALSTEIELALEARETAPTCGARSLWLPDQKTERAFGLGLGQQFESRLAGEVGHIDPGHGIVGQQPDPGARRRVFQGPTQAQGRHGAMVAPGVDQDLGGFFGHGPRISQDLPTTSPTGPGMPPSGGNSETIS